jgi:dipeptidyl aminopeptidase/acylaminoacyl peptidase
MKTNDYQAVCLLSLGLIFWTCEVLAAGAKHTGNTLRLEVIAGHFDKDTVVSNPGKTVLFIPGEVPADAAGSAAPAFSPDGKKLFFGQSTKSGSYAIFLSLNTTGKWSVPEVAKFSGKYRDLEPAFSTDGKYVIFASNRPFKPDMARLDGHYNGEVFRLGGGNLWKAAMTPKGITDPERLPDEINSSSSVFSPALTGDGSLYFMRADSGLKFHIYRSQLKNGNYETPVRASFSLNGIGDYDPVVSPDESFLIFSSGRAPAPKTTDLFIVFRTQNGWSEPLDLRSVLGSDVQGVEARLSPDLHMLFFSNSRNSSGVDVPTQQYTWKTDISQLLKLHGIDLTNR